MTGMSPIGCGDAAAAARMVTNRSMHNLLSTAALIKIKSDGEALAAPAGALGVRVVKHEAGGEIVLTPVHDRSDQVEHRRAIDVEGAAGGLDFLVERLLLGYIIDRIS